MRYFVISPNAANDGRMEEYLAYMRQHRVVFMGWDSSRKYGNIFSQIQPGDCILVAQRRNWMWYSYFTGIADSRSSNDNLSGEGFEQCIELRQVTDFGNDMDLLPFNEGCTSFWRRNPGAIFQLHENNKQDQKIIRLLRYFAAQSSKSCTLREIAHWQDNQRVVIPALQRGLVWSPKQVELLWDSLLRGFPIGSFAIAPAAQNPDQNTNGSASEYYLLDGQQRYNAISLAYHQIGEKDQAALWLDFAPKTIKNTSRKFWFKATTAAHPWGFTNDDSCGILGWTKYREALQKFCPTATEKDIQKIRLQDLSLTDTWPVEASCPIPFSVVMSCFMQVDIYGTELPKKRFIELLNVWINDFKETHQKFSPKEIDNNVAGNIFDALSWAQDYTIPVNVLKKQIINAPESENTDGTSNLEHLFTRLNTLGSPISPYDLRYSAIKAYWAEIKTSNDDIASKIMPAAYLAVLAFRLALTVTSEKEGFANTPSIPEIREMGKIVNSPSHQFIRNLYQNNGYLLRKIIFTVETMLNVGSENNPDGLPPFLRTSILLNSPDVYLALMYLAYKEISSECSANLNWQGTALWLHWLSGKNKKQNVDSLKEVLDNPSVSALKNKLEELCAKKQLISLIPQFDLGDYQEQNWRIDNFNEKNWKPLLNFCLWNRELLIFSERNYFNKTFCYDPALQNFLQGHNKPWDLDHIVPQAWIGRQGKTMGPWKELCRQWLWANGNFAAIPFSINRGKRDTAEWQEYCSHATELQFDPCVSQLRDGLTENAESAKLFAKITWERTLKIYNSWRNTLRFLC